MKAKAVFFVFLSFTILLLASRSLCTETDSKDKYYRILSKLTHDYQDQIIGLSEDGVKVDLRGFITGFVFERGRLKEITFRDEAKKNRLFAVQSIKWVLFKGKDKLAEQLSECIGGDSSKDSLNLSLDKVTGTPEGKVIQLTLKGFITELKFRGNRLKSLIFTDTGGRVRTLSNGRIRKVSIGDKEQLIKTIAELKANVKGFKGSTLARSRPAAVSNGKGHKCFVIPVKGILGLNITEKVFREALRIARAYSCKHKSLTVILEIDSEGGRSGGLTNLLQVLSEFDDLRIIAYVREALSEAAVLAMSCKEIVMNPTGSIGGPLFYRFTPNGSAANVEEKMQSIWRSQIRASVASAGHNILFFNGMTNPSISLKVKQTESGPLLAQSGEGKTLKSRGEALSLNAKEAVASGLALGASFKIEKCNSFLKIDSWQKLPSSKAEYCINKWNREIAQAKKQYRVELSKAGSYLKKAVNTDPTSYSDYKYNFYTGKLKIKSRRLWTDRSDACCKLLERTNEHLGEARSIAKSYPELDLPPQLIQEIRKQIAVLQAAILRMRKRVW